MTSRPRSVTIISWLFIAVGIGSLLKGLLPPSDPEIARHYAAAEAQRPIEHAFIHVVHALALLGGVFMLCRQNWARWLLVAWMAFHLVIGALHSLGATLMHILMFSVILYFLFHPGASAFFRGARTPAPVLTKNDDPA